MFVADAADVLCSKRSQTHLLNSYCIYLSTTTQHLIVVLLLPISALVHCDENDLPVLALVCIDYKHLEGGTASGTFRVQGTWKVLCELCVELMNRCILSTQSQEGILVKEGIYLFRSVNMIGTFDIRI